MKSIVLTGGGTAGHVMPNIALIPKLQEKGFQIHYMGTPDGMERALIEPLEGVTYHPVRSGKLRRYFSLQNFVDPFKIVAGFFDAKKALKSINPSVVFSKGGFATVPVIMAAKSNKIPTVLHESDYTPGLANKLSIKYSDKILVTFEDTLEHLPSKSIFAGTPIRQEIYEGNRKKACELCGFSGNKPILLCTGGSQGAQAINKFLRDNIDRLTQTFDIIHLCGKNNLDPAFEKTAGYRQFEFAQSEMRDFLVAADVIVSRAGANSIFEFLALNKPSLLIPLPSAASRGDQILNSEYFEKKGYSLVLAQEQITDELFVSSINELYNNRQKYIDNMSSDKQCDGTESVLTEILKMV